MHSWFDNYQVFTSFEKVLNSAEVTSVGSLFHCFMALLEKADCSKAVLPLGILHLLLVVLVTFVDISVVMRIKWYSPGSIALI